MNNKLKLDSRITGTNPIKTIFNLDDVVIGDIGFFADDLSPFENLDFFEVSDDFFDVGDYANFGFIENFDLSKDSCFVTSDQICYRYFLPLHKITKHDAQKFLLKYYPRLANLWVDDDTTSNDSAEPLENNHLPEEKPLTAEKLLTVEKVEIDGDGLNIFARIENKKALKHILDVLYRSNDTADANNDKSNNERGIKKVQPEDKNELLKIINETIEKEGFECDLNFIDTSLIKDMSCLFEDSKFNGDISRWDVSNVTDMRWMFHCAESFNQPLDKWDVSNVEDMSWMFYDAYSFNQPLNSWNVSNVKGMRGMFSEARAFNQPIDEWDVSNVEDMSWMFNWAESFNQPLNKWNVSKVKDMFRMFIGSRLEEKPLKWYKA